MRWFIIENIAIYVLTVAGIVWSHTGWPLFLLAFVNYRQTARKVPDEE